MALVKTYELSKKQIAMVNEMRAFFGKQTILTRSDLVRFMQEKRNKIWAPGFVVRNEAFKVTDKEGNVVRGKWRLFSTSVKALRARQKKSTPVVSEVPAITEETVIV
jgi:hypothetical protein